MSTRLFDSSRWTTQELEEWLRKLETMVLTNQQQTTFKDQTIIFKSRMDLMKTIDQVMAELANRTDATSTGSAPLGAKTKRVQITSRSKGFK